MPKIQISIFFKILRSITSYTYVLKENILFFDFRWSCHEISCPP